MLLDKPHGEEMFAESVEDDLMDFGVVDSDGEVDFGELNQVNQQLLSDSSEDFDMSDEDTEYRPFRPPSAIMEVDEIERGTPARPFPDKPFYWMNDTETIDFILKTFEQKDFYVICGPDIILDFATFVSEHRGQDLMRYSFHLRVRAGKGGFGSLLKSFRVNKSTNKLMMRDLNGRRLASKDEEDKLKRHLERMAKKEEEAKAKRHAKLERLKAGPGKHQFDDQDYLQRSYEILEKTEDACEAGFAHLKQLKQQQKEGGAQCSKDQNQVSSDDDDEVMDVDDLFSKRGGNKRKIIEPTVGDEVDLKRSRGDSLDAEEFSDSDDDEEEVDLEQLKAIQDYFKNKEKEDENVQALVVTEEVPVAHSSEPVVYAPINLDTVESSAQLEQLGLDHLKAALTDRGIKCGGTLQERAERLFSVKGLTESEYPKSILTPALKAKLAKAAEKLSEKKKGKKKKN